MTDDWLREMHDRNIFTPTLLDFNVALDIIAYSLLLEKHMCYGFTPSAILWIESDLSNRTQRVLWLYTPCYTMDKELPV
jgi:hypothetical protein